MSGLLWHFTLTPSSRDFRYAKTLPTFVFAPGASHELGAATKSRTRDLLITNQLLYQLSYSGT